MELGKVVLKPIGDNARYDLVIEDAGRFLRVQCKTAQYGDPHGNSILFASCSNTYHANGGKRGYHGDADLFGVYFPPLRKVYLVPVDEFGATQVRLRLNPARNGQVKRLRYASEFEL
jgi:hypothetical protein